MGRDHTIHAGIDGQVAFFKTSSIGRHKRKHRTYINVIPVDSDGSELQTYKEHIMNRYKDILAFKASFKHDAISKMEKKVAYIAKSQAHQKEVIRKKAQKFERAQKRRAEEKEAAIQAEKEAQKLRAQAKA